MILLNFPKYCMKLRNFWAMGGGGPGAGGVSLDPPLYEIIKFVIDRRVMLVVLKFPRPNKLRATPTQQCLSADQTLVVYHKKNYTSIVLFHGMVC